MIRVDYYPADHRLTVKGHANSAPRGEDLICCAASAYMYALQYNVEFLYDKGWMTDIYVRMDPGDTEIRCNPIEDKSHMTTMLFNWMSMGFFILEADHPDYVVCKVHDRLPTL